MKTPKPKEKALELYKKAGEFAHANLFSFREESFNANCKGIALLIVDEADRIHINYMGREMDEDIVDKKRKYWKEVEKEIKEIKPTKK